MECGVVRQSTDWPSCWWHVKVNRKSTGSWYFVIRKIWKGHDTLRDGAPSPFCLWEQQEHLSAGHGWGTDSHGKEQLPPELWILTNMRISRRTGKGSQPPKPHSIAEPYGQHLPKHQPSSVGSDLKSNERREWVGRALVAFHFNEQKSLCTNTACETFCFRGQVYCPYIISTWQRKECALSSLRWMQPRSKITSEAVNNNFESISRIV